LDLCLQHPEHPVVHHRAGDASGELLQGGPDRVGLGQLLAGDLADACSSVRLRLAELHRLEVPECLPHGSLAHAELLDELELHHTLTGLVGPLEDPLDDELLDLRTKHRVVESHASPSTTPVAPLTRTRSPVLIWRVASEVPTTAGMPNSR